MIKFCPFCNNLTNNKNHNKNIIIDCSSGECTFQPMIKLINNEIINWDIYANYNNKQIIIESFKDRQESIIHSNDDSIRSLEKIDVYFPFPENGLNDLNIIINTIFKLVQYT